MSTQYNRIKQITIQREFYAKPFQKLYDHNDIMQKNILHILFIVYISTFPEIEALGRVVNLQMNLFGPVLR